MGPRFVTKIENNRIYVVVASESGIRAGNLVMVDQDTSPRIGDLVLVAIESGWGIRKLIKSNGKVYLESDTERLGVREEYLVAGKVVMVVCEAFFAMPMQTGLMPLIKNKTMKENEVLSSLIEKNIISKSDIFDYNESPFKDEFESIDTFYQNNLLHYSSRYEIWPCAIFINNDFSANAKAAKKEEFYIVSINMGTVFKLINYFYDNTDLINDDGLKEYQEFETHLDNPIHILLHQMALHFTFYHEMAHLVQRSDFLASTIFEDINNESNFSIERHVLELDADEFSAISIIAHVTDYGEKTFEEELTQEKMQILITIACSAILIYFLSFDSYKNAKEIYTRETTHPHPAIRIIWIIITMVQYVNQDLIGRGHKFNLDEKDTVQRVLNFSKLVGIKIFGDDTVSEFLESIETNLLKVATYLSELQHLKHTDPSLAVSKWNYLAREEMKKTDQKQK